MENMEKKDVKEISYLCYEIIKDFANALIEKLSFYYDSERLEEIFHKSLTETLTRKKEEIEKQNKDELQKN